MLFAGLELARRLEGSEAAATGACAKQALAADPSCGACVERVAGGWAICFGASSPLNKCVGVGLHGPVSGDDLDRVEAVFRSRGAKVVLDLCPLADSSLIELLSQRGYTIAEIENDGAKITIKLKDGKSYKTAISGSRTNLQIAGKKADRKELKVGQVCAITAPADGQEASQVACK